MTVRTGTELTLPHSLELERAILNASLEWGHRLPDDLDGADFYRHANTIVAKAIGDAQREELDTHYPVIREVLRGRGQLDAVGDVYLHELARDGVTPNAACIESTVLQLKTLARKRRAAEIVLRHARDITNVDLDQLAKEIDDLKAINVGKTTYFQTAKALSTAAERVDWILRGYLARGAITELTGKAKLAGKTTLAAHIMGSIISGSYCLGDRAQRGKVVYLTEQTRATFQEVLRRAGLHECEDISILSFWDVKHLSWPAIAALAGREATRIGAHTIKVDTLSQFAGIKGDGENNSGDALEALEPCQQLAHQNFAVLVTRHARKSGGEVGEDGRGSSAFTGGVDIVLSLKRPEGRHAPSMRLLEGVSRFSETPSRLVIDKRLERSVHSGTPEIEVWSESYVVLGDTDAVAHDEAREAIDLHIPVEEGAAVTVVDLISATNINRATLNRALKARKDIKTTGTGRKGDPLRYFKPEVVSVQTSNSGFLA